MATSSVTLNEIFSSNIRKYRKQCGQTQNELEGSLGLARYHVCLLESGNCLVTPELLEKLTKEFNVPVKSLFMTDNETTIADTISMGKESILSCIDNKIGNIDIKAIFAKNLKRIREDKCLSLNDIAIQINVNRGYLMSVEKGRVLAKIDIIDKLAEVLEVPAWTFFEDNDAKDISDKIKSIIQNGMADIIDKIQKLD